MIGRFVSVGLARPPKLRCSTAVLRGTNVMNSLAAAMATAAAGGIFLSICYVCLDP